VDHEFPNRKRFPSRAHPPFYPSLPLGRNANGDKKLKPLLFYRSKNTRALKNVVKSSLPVVWNSHRRPGLRGRFSVLGLLNISCQKRKQYCAEDDLDFRILLILDNAVLMCLIM
jgi:hypothetical protein